MTKEKLRELADISTLRDILDAKKMFTNQVSILETLNLHPSFENKIIVEKQISELKPLIKELESILKSRTENDI